MSRYLTSTVLGLLLTTPLLAHFVFVVPQPANKGVQVVFSDDLEPDENVSIDKIAGLELFARGPAGDAPLKTIKAAHSLIASPPAGTSQIFGSITYGVSQKGKGGPYLLRYHPRAILGDALTTRLTLGDRVPVEVVPVGKVGAVRFQILAKGKPLAGADVTVMLPGGDRAKVTSDAEGRTPAYTGTGRYGVWTKAIDPTPGTLADKKYDETRNYATLVVDVGAR